MCGEHTLWTLAFRLSMGSSPHVRGALKCLRDHNAITGIIPACAGST